MERKVVNMPQNNKKDDDDKSGNEGRIGKDVLDVGSTIEDKPLLEQHTLIQSGDE